MSTRYWRYEVDEVWGRPIPNCVIGSIVIDRWKSDRTWQFYKIPQMEPTSGFHAKLIGEVTEPDALAQIAANRRRRVSP